MGIFDKICLTHHISCKILPWNLRGRHGGQPWIDSNQSRIIKRTVKNWEDFLTIRFNVEIFQDYFPPKKTCKENVDFTFSFFPGERRKLTTYIFLPRGQIFVIHHIYQGRFYTKTINQKIVNPLIETKFLDYIHFHVFYLTLIFTVSDNFWFVNIFFFLSTCNVNKISLNLLTYTNKLVKSQYASTWALLIYTDFKNSPPYCSVLKKISKKIKISKNFFNNLETIFWMIFVSMYYLENGF